MSKFSAVQLKVILKDIKLLFGLAACILAIQGCAHSSSNSKSEISSPPEESINDKIEVDKNTNSIKIKPNSTVGKSVKATESIKNNRPFFDWPVNEARMTRGFLPKGTKRSRRPHKGIDLAAPRGSPVLASHDGVVLYAGKEFKGYGKMVMIEANGWATLYGHMDKIVVYEGKKIKQGEVIGALGNTGRSSGPHLHFEIRKLDGPIDPLPYLPAGEALTNDVDNGAEEY